MRVEARLDGSGILLWLVVIVVAAGLAWWDFEDEDPNVPGIVWMDIPLDAGPPDAGR